jgi:RNA polymerase sigma-70 factor, ECF subfamily
MGIEHAGAAAGAENDPVDIRATLGGDSEAYARLVQRYQSDVAAMMWRFTRDRKEWEELVQDVFVEAWLSLAGYRSEAPFIHWLKRIATRVGYRYWQRRARQREHRLVPLAEWDGAIVAGDDPAPAEAAALLHGLLARLDPKDRLALTLMYLEECSIAEIADRTGWSRVATKMRVSRARSRLRKIVVQDKLTERLGWPL